MPIGCKSINVHEQHREAQADMLQTDFEEEEEEGNGGLY